MRAYMRASYASLVRQWIVNLRAYSWSFFVSGLVSGLLTVALAYFFYHSLAEGRPGQDFIAYSGTADYMTYMILGAAILTFTIRIVLGVSRSLITERREGTLESLLLASTQHQAYFMGIVLLYMILSLGETTVILLATWPLGLNLTHINWATLLLALPVTVLGLLGVAMVLGAFMLVTGDTYLLQNTLFAVLTLICGFFFPLEYLPLPIQWLAQMVPVTGGLNLMRAALLRGLTPVDVGQDVLVYSLLSIGYVLAGLWLIRRAAYRSLEGV